VTRVSRGIDRIEATFDDPSLVANAGLVVPATLMVRLGLEGLVDRSVRLVGRVGGSRPGRKVLTLVATMAGGSHSDHADVLRSGATRAVLPFRVMAPSTLGTFLRSFTFGHVRQLDAVIAEALRRAWGLGADPRDDTMTIDVDSTICEVHGHAKQGAAYGYTRAPGLPPAAGDLRRDRRGVARPATQGLQPAGRQTLRRRAGGSPPPGPGPHRLAQPLEPMLSTYPLTL
jgi:hypothetical protein